MLGHFSLKQHKHKSVGYRPGAIPALWEAEMSGSLEVRSSRTVWPAWRSHISTKNAKIILGIVAPACNPSY